VVDAKGLEVVKENQDLRVGVGEEEEHVNVVGAKGLGVVKENPGPSVNN